MTIERDADNALETLQSELGEDAYFPFGFPISKQAWETFGCGDLVNGDQAQGLKPLHTLAERVSNRAMDEAPELPPVTTGQLLCVGLLQEVLRFVAARYCADHNPGSMQHGLIWTRERAGGDAVSPPMHSFVDLFPPIEVQKGRIPRNDYLKDDAAHASNGGPVAREIALLAVATANPALVPYRSLFNDDELERRAPYRALVTNLETFFGTQPALPPVDMTLFEMLRAPMMASPHSLEGQLDYIRDHWRELLPETLVRHLLQARDVLREETLERGLGPGTIDVLRFDQETSESLELHYEESERFTQDAGWMADVVLLAKSTFVWLDQLSKKYERDITTLDQIPDEELDRLADWGFTGLWLIGLWERSTASQRLKEWMGNPDAAASAYSLYDYEIAHELGGQGAYDNLKARAWDRGIRLASDMVPNHVGLFSKWMVEHPEWFIQSDHPPFPAYTFDGGNLSDDDSITVQIEDGYWEHRDAAVVFKRTDNNSGDTRYIYHGNDGTSMPWNDTAQLNYMLPEVREAVIQTILHVARMSPIIRFDAAMTLSKKHYQRLWFPQPGDGGAIPSRAEQGLTREGFDAHMPEEFWREVVDRVQEEVPDTLLLAEAFWLMEGYFVRTLGMHRVYNSAFMNMLKMEENLNYRQTIKNVLEFSPEVLKRFVNFMNNPDEDTAVAQFGKGDKYIGVAVLMSTMPGLPMFGHGQMEGFTEKYGMEFRRAYWDEQVDDDLMARHYRHVFPLLRLRHMFSGVDHFAFFDFHTPDGHVNENVYAYSNRSKNQRGMVLYNNAYDSARGWVNRSCAINTGSADEPFYVHPSVAEALGLRQEDDYYYIYRDHATDLEYIRSGHQIAEQGIYVELGGYQYAALLDWRKVVDRDGSWAEIAHRLGGNGVPNVAEAHKATKLEGLQDAFATVMNGPMLKRLSSAPKDHDGLVANIQHFDGAMRTGLHAIAKYMKRDIDRDVVLPPIREKLASIQRFAMHDAWNELGKQPRDFIAALAESQSGEPAGFLRIPVAWALTEPLKLVFMKKRHDDTGAVHWLDDWLLTPVIREALYDLCESERHAHDDAALLRVLIRHAGWLLEDEGATVERVRALFDDPLVAAYVNLNEYEGVQWFNQEQFESMLNWLFVIAVVELLSDPKAKPGDRTKRIDAALAAAQKIIVAAKKAGYDLEKMIKAL
jgi:glycosidase